MTKNQQTIRTPEKNEAQIARIAPERSGNGTYDDGWKPGDPDPHTSDVYACSSEGSPGIKPVPVLIDIGGIIVQKDWAIAHGLYYEENNDAASGTEC